MKKELIKLANHLDRIGHTKEADFVDNLLKKAEEGEDCENCDGDTFFDKRCHQNVSRYTSFDKSDENIKTLIQEIKSKKAAEGLLDSIFSPDPDNKFISDKFLEDNIGLIETKFREFLSDRDYIDFATNFLDYGFPLHEAARKVYKMDPEEFVKNYIWTIGSFLREFFFSQGRFDEEGFMDINRLCYDKLKDYAMSANKNNIEDFKKNTRYIVLQLDNDPKPREVRYFDLNADNGLELLKKAVYIIESTLMRHGEGWYDLYNRQQRDSKRRYDI